MPHPKNSSSSSCHPQQVEGYFRTGTALQTHRSVSISPRLDILQSMLDELRHQALVQAEHDERIKMLEHQVEPDPRHYAITGWSNLRGIKMRDEDYSRFGLFAAKEARRRGVTLGMRKHSVYGTVNTYPLEFLDEVYELWQRK
jgi:hypothetical protein